MAEYIEREDAIEAMFKVSDKCTWIPFWNEQLLALEELPAADIQPVKHGRWISIGHKLSRICSVCNCDEPYKFADDDANVYNYCPNCGADMRGE